MSVAKKINRVLAIFLLAFLAIVLRIWHLGVIQREEKLAEAQKPQQRTILLKADRGIISDRFHIPLAVNKISYNAAIYYGQISQIPTVSWKSNPEGKQIKTFPRKEYIRNLSETIAKPLQLDPNRIEDLINSKAALFPHAPFILKHFLSEEEYYRLRMLEKDWLGLHAEISSHRFYPLNQTGCGVIGTMGAISQKEYATIAQEISDLQNLEDPSTEQLSRLDELKEKSYSLNDFVGKTGIEGQFEEDLRGFFGKKTFEVDQKGRFVREISSKEPIAGQNVVLSISSELQEFAESLLAEDERTRDGRSLFLNAGDKVKKPQKQPWIKGGAIVALDPKTGEVLALASYPRFNPNDFIASNNAVCRWLENEPFIAAVWDGHEELIRERGLSFQRESLPLTWEAYLDSILPIEGPLRPFFNGLDDLKKAIQLQEDYEAFLYFNRLNLSPPPDVQKRLDSIALSPQDKLFAVDICRTVVYAPAFTDELIEQIGSMKLSTYHDLKQSFFRYEQTVRAQAQKQFHEGPFRDWRQNNQKKFLAEMRKIEKEKKTYARPYIDYLDKKEKELFEDEWKERRIELVAGAGFNEDLIRTFRPFSELTRPLLGTYKSLRNRKKTQTEKDLASAFYPIGGYGFSRSYAFETSSPQGSIFKLVTAYEGLRQGKQLTIIDHAASQHVASQLSGIPYPRYYKGGRLPRSAALQIGKIDLPGALEVTSNPYFAILAGDCLEDPEDLSRAARQFGFGEKTGIDLPREAKGMIPNDLKTNRTGLYSTAIGQHTLLTTPLQTALMMAGLANGGKIFKPKLVKQSIGLTPDRQPLQAFSGPNYFAKKELAQIGIEFPLFTGEQPRAPLSEIAERPTEIRKTIFLDAKIRLPLFEGMERVIWGTKGSARAHSIKALRRNPTLMRSYLSLQNQLIGKTGTAEIACNFSMNPTAKAQLYKYIWFGGIAFNDLRHEEPELVVVVFLRYGDAGKEAAPLASQMIHKWREIKKKHS